jgi:hypothetical protein
VGERKTVSTCQTYTPNPCLGVCTALRTSTNVVTQVDGILSALLWLLQSWENRWIFTAEALTCAFRTTTTSSRSQRRTGKKTAVRSGYEIPLGLLKSVTNELTQVNYFLHMGHLSISGSKMSKSLKNFTTIREALGRGEWNARSLRIIFLLGGWHDGIEITPDLRKAGTSWESYVTNFFLKVRTP